jgi:hypothetical protein
MHPLLALGRIVALDELAASLKVRIEDKGLGPPRSFVRWAEQILVDHPEGKGLVLEATTALPGDLEIDDEGLAEHGITTIAVFGDLTVNGRLINADSDGGPFLFVDGNLIAGQIEKGGASFIILGSVACRGVVFCDYNHGALLIGGDLSGEAIITCDQEVHAGGEIRGPVISDDLGNMRDMLVPEVFEDPDDPEDEFADGALIRARLAEGLPVLKV